MMMMIIGSLGRINLEFTSQWKLLLSE